LQDKIKFNPKIATQRPAQVFVCTMHTDDLIVAGEDQEHAQTLTDFLESRSAQ
jgi:hypothetical protein